MLSYESGETASERERWRERGQRIPVDTALAVLALLSLDDDTVSLLEVMVVFKGEEVEL